MSKIVVGDIGGTNARFGLAYVDSEDTVIIENYEKYSCDDFEDFKGLFDKYLRSIDKAFGGVCLAVAGPKKDNAIKLTNRNWKISEAEVINQSGVESVHMCNDFVAMARSIPEMSEHDFRVLHDGIAQHNEPILVAGAGTGFGVSYLVPTMTGWRVQNTEGGHIAYAPRNKTELEILSILLETHKFVPIELLTSGSGLVSLHKAICKRHSKAFRPISPVDIRQRAQDGDMICAEICEIRAGAIMGALGDLALAGGTKGGIILAGGVSEKNIEFCIKPKAMQNYFIRGPRSDYLREIPIRLITNARAALIGAAAVFMDKKKSDT